MEFTNPPKSGREARTDKWREIVARLKEEPNEWAYVGEYSPGVAALIRQGTYPAFIDKNSALPAHSQMAMNWEVTTRKAKAAGRRTDLYIRYVG